MTAQEQRIAIAESVGIKVIQGCVIEKGCDCWLKALPDYLNDLNAMAQAEATLRHPEKMKYHELLVVECGTHGIIFATATQRAEAYLLTKQL